MTKRKEECEDILPLHRLSDHEPSCPHYVARNSKADLRSVVSGEMYNEIGYEMQGTDLTLADFDKRVVKRVGEWAEINGWPWPPQENEVDRRNREAGFILL